MSKNKFYVTSSIAYTNAPPHIGFALEVIQADVIARYHRILGENVFFLTGTDEHGTKIVRTAEKAGKTPKKFTNEISKRYKALTQALNLSNDDFIRTTDQRRHWPGVQKVWLRLKEKGDIYKKKYKGFYCVGCEVFIPEKDLVNKKCSIHQKKPEVIEEENYFFRLSKYSKEIEKIIERDKIKIIPKKRKNEILNFVKQGLKDISFSRPRKNLKWGIPVPDDKSQSIYVWGDALVNYISALNYAEDSKKFKKYWPADVHFIGKDIIRFHTIIWEGMLLSLGLELPKTIFIHGFITVGGQKMSKSLGNIIDPFQLVEKYGTDAVRYFLLRESSPFEDLDFTYEKFEKRYNADLAKGIGNLVSRVISLVEKLNLGSKIPKLERAQNPEFQSEINKAWKKYKKALEGFKFNEALASVWELISFCDEDIEKERIWEKSDKQLLIINDLFFALTNIAKMLNPFLPETSGKILEQLKIKKSKLLFPRLNLA